jgi:hypothetical protein
MTYFHPHVPPSWRTLPIFEHHTNSILLFLGDLWPRSKDTAKDEKYHDPKISYQFNSLGYRDAEYKDRYDTVILSFGMSSTMGLAIQLEQTYSKLIEQHTGISVLNFGIPGASADTIARMVSCTVPYFKERANTVMVLVGWPYVSRREVFLDNYKQSVNTNGTPPFPEFWMLLDNTSNSHNAELNAHFVDQICKANAVRLISIPISIYPDGIESGDKGRDGVNPGPEWNKRVAEWVLATL